MYPASSGRTPPYHCLFSRADTTLCSIDHLGPTSDSPLQRVPKCRMRTPHRRSRHWRVMPRPTNQIQSCSPLPSTALYSLSKQDHVMLSLVWLSDVKCMRSATSNESLSRRHFQNLRKISCMDEIRNYNIFDSWYYFLRSSSPLILDRRPV